MASGHSAVASTRYPASGARRPGPGPDLAAARAAAARLGASESGPGLNAGITEAERLPSQAAAPHISEINRRSQHMVRSGLRRPRAVVAPPRPPEKSLAGGRQARRFYVWQVGPGVQPGSGCQVPRLYTATRDFYASLFCSRGVG